MWKYEPAPASLQGPQINEIKERVTMVAVAERYGFQIVKGKIKCPFHNDKSPSCYIYPGIRGFHCFACGAGGSVIDFTARLFSLTPSEAAARLDTDFCLGLSSHPADNVSYLRWQRERSRREAEATAEHEKWLLKSLEMRRLRQLPYPSTHAMAAQIGSCMGRLAYLEYLTEESVYPDLIKTEG